MNGFKDFFYFFWNEIKARLEKTFNDKFCSFKSQKHLKPKKVQFSFVINRTFLAKINRVWKSFFSKDNPTFCWLDITPFQEKLKFLLAKNLPNFLSPILKLHKQYILPYFTVLQFCIVHGSHCIFTIVNHQRISTF